MSPSVERRQWHKWLRPKGMRLDWLLDLEGPHVTILRQVCYEKRTLGGRPYFCNSVLKGTAGIPALLYSGAAGLSAQA